MNQTEIGKSKLKEAFTDYCKYYMENLETTPVDGSSFSPKLNKNMEKLIRAQKKPMWKYVNTVGKRIAVACIIIAVLTGVLMSCKPIREPVIKFFVNVYERFTEIFTSSNSPDIPITLEERKTLTYVPEGYELSLADTRRLIWENDKEEIIEFLQSTLNNGDTTFDTEETIYNIIETGNDKIYYVITKETAAYYWFNNEYRYCIFCSSEMSLDEVLKMINSIQ